MSGPPGVEYRISGSALVVRGTLSPGEQSPLEQALRRLVDSDFRVVTVDLVQVDVLCNACAAHITLVLMWLKQRDRGALVRAGRQGFRSLQTAGAEALAKLELVES